MPTVLRVGAQSKNDSVTECHYRGTTHILIYIFLCDLKRQRKSFRSSGKDKWDRNQEPGLQASGWLVLYK